MLSKEIISIISDKIKESFEGAKRTSLTTNVHYIRGYCRRISKELEIQSDELDMLIDLLQSNVPKDQIEDMSYEECLTYLYLFERN